MRSFQLNGVSEPVDRFVIDPLRPQRDFESDLHGPSAQRRQIEELRLLGMDDLHEDDVRRIRELQVEVVELRDVRCIYPEVVLLSYPRAEAFALHGFRADVERNFGQELFGQVEVLERVLPALLVRTFGGAACAWQTSLLLQADVLSHELFAARSRRRSRLLSADRESARRCRLVVNTRRMMRK